MGKIVIKLLRKDLEANQLTAKHFHRKSMQDIINTDLPSHSNMVGKLWIHGADWDKVSCHWYAVNLRDDMLRQVQ